MTDPTLNHWDHLGPIDTRALDAACREPEPMDLSAFAPGEPAPSWCVPTVVYLSLLGISVLAAVVAVIGGLR